MKFEVNIYLYIRLTCESDRTEDNPDQEMAGSWRHFCWKKEKEFY